jgi:hypothetical protein
MSAKRILGVLLLIAILSGLAFQQWWSQREVQRLVAELSSSSAAQHQSVDEVTAKLHQAEARYEEARAQLQIAERKLADATDRITALGNLSSPTEKILSTRRLGPRSGVPPGNALVFEPTAETSPPGVKRSWGPEQVVGEPDTLQAGDISTAWAPRQQDGGEEWLKLDYESSVDIAEVRVRETYNPGAISKVTAFLADGREVTIWEGVEPKSEAPVEMAFAVPNSINAKSVKVYLDTKRVPGWNEIDAVQLVGKDGSQQWAKQASASSTYAEQGGRGLNELENLGLRSLR